MRGIGAWTLTVSLLVATARCGGTPSQGATPTPAQAIWGSYAGTLHDYEYRKPIAGQPIVVVADRTMAQSYVVIATGAGTATLKGWLNGADLCPDGIPLSFNQDGTLTFRPNFECPQICAPPGAVCPCFAQFIFGGTGTWDYAGRLTFLVHMDLSGSCGDVYGDQTFTGRKQ